MRSRAGVGMTPPKVLGAPKPTSSVMISSTLGAPLGGTTRGAHQAFDCAAFSLITPPNFGSGGGSCCPPMVVVALGEPGTPVVCTAEDSGAWPGARRERRSNCAEHGDNRLSITTTAKAATTGRRQHRVQRTAFEVFMGNVPFLIHAAAALWTVNSVAPELFSRSLALATSSAEPWAMTR